MRFQLLALALVVFTTPVLADGLSTSAEVFVGPFSCGPEDGFCAVSGTFDDGNPDDFYVAKGSARGIARFGHLLASAMGSLQGGLGLRGFPSSARGRLNSATR